jgi:hypothetical protein
MVAALEEHGCGNVAWNQFQTGEEASDSLRPFAAAI